MSELDMKVYGTIEEMKRARRQLGNPGALNEAIVATGIDALFVLLEGGTVEFEGIGKVKLITQEGLAVEENDDELDALTKGPLRRLDSECDVSGHDWERDPERRGDGLLCARCHVTEAEMEATRNRTTA